MTEASEIAESRHVAISIVFIALAFAGMMVAVVMGVTEAHRLGTERVAACSEAGGTWIQNDDGQSCTM